MTDSLKEQIGEMQKRQAEHRPAVPGAAETELKVAKEAAAQNAALVGALAAALPLDSVCSFRKPDGTQVRIPTITLNVGDQIIIGVDPPWRVTHRSAELSLANQHGLPRWFMLVVYYVAPVTE